MSSWLNDIGWVAGVTLLLLGISLLGLLIVSEVYQVLYVAH